MDVKTKVKILVQQVVEAYLKEQLHGKEKQSIAILLGYQSQHPSVVLKTVSSLLKTYEATLILSKEWLNGPARLDGKQYVILEETTQQELNRIVEKSSILVVPVASYRLVSKLALTLDDELAVWMAIQYQLLGKPIVMAKDYIEPNVYQQILAPNSLLERLQSYIRQIQTDQVKWVPLSKLTETVEDQITAYQEKQYLILAKHVEKAYQEGLKELVVPDKSRVTPSGKDLAKDLKIQITTSTLKGGAQ